jgi:hypothetical protein
MGASNSIDARNIIFAIECRAAKSSVNSWDASTSRDASNSREPAKERMPTRNANQQRSNINRGISSHKQQQEHQKTRKNRNAGTLPIAW